MGAFNACTSWGYLFEQGRGVPRDLVRATDLYRVGCEGGNAQGCANLGVLFETGKAPTLDLGKAAESYHKACVRGLADGCGYRAGVIAKLRESCEKKPDPASPSKKPPKPSGEGCNNLGYVYEQGLGVPADPREAARLYQKACDADQPIACANLGILYEKGTGVGQDYAVAARLYKKACDKNGGTGCTNLGFLHESALGIRTPDEKRALELYRRGCDHGSEQGCANARVLVRRDEARKRELNEKKGKGPSRAH